jgi:hypothetical protein
LGSPRAQFVQHTEQRTGEMETTGEVIHVTLENFDFTNLASGLED